MPRARIILLRHGETLANREFRHIGSRDDSLTDKGREQAEQAGKALATLPIAAVYTSPLKRAFETAEAVARHHKLVVQSAAALRESSFGDWEGMTRDEIADRSEADAAHLRKWDKDPLLAPPGGESFSDMQARCCAFLDELAVAHDGGTLLLVSHVGPIKALLAEALQSPAQTSRRIFLDPACISVIDWVKDSDKTVRLVNCHAHMGWDKARWLEK